MSDLNELLRQIPAAQGPSIWTDRPPMPGPDTAPAATALRFKLRSSVDASNMQPDFVGRVNRLYEMMPEKLRDTAEVTDAVRSRERQAQAFLRFQEGTGGRAAAPGQSQHDPDRRAALDFADTPALKWLWTAEGKKALETAGLAMPFGDDRGHMQMSEVGARGAAVAEGKRASNNQLSPNEFAALIEKSPSEASASRSTMEALGEGFASEAEASVEFGRQSAALLNGIRKGAMDVPLGVAQATLPRAAMELVERQIRDFNSQFSELEEKHPGFDFVGRLTGSTITILTGSGLLGAGAKAVGLAPLVPRALTAAWEAIRTIGRTGVIGAGIGGTAFYPEGPEQEQRPFGVPARAFDTVIGTLFGLSSGAVARGVEWAARNLADTTYGQQFLQVLQRTAGGIARNSEAPLSNTLAYYRRVEQAASSRYSLRNEIGKQFEGFPSGVGVSEVGAEPGFSQAIDEALAASRKAGVETRRTVEGAARRVEQLLGLDKERGRLAEWQAKQQLYEQQLERAREARKPFEGPEPDARLTAEEAAAMRQRNAANLQMREVAGQVPPLPEPPAPYQPRPVPADAYAQARTALNASIRRSKDPAARTQLQMLLRGMDNTATAAAAKHGMEADEFLRRATAANKFYERNVAPLRQFFGGKTAREVEGRAGVPLDGMTPAAFYDRVAKIIENDDIAQIKDVAKALGPRGRDNMKMIAAAQALADTEGRAGRTAFNYIRKHEDGLRELLGRDEYTQLVGMGKVADRLASKFKEQPGKTVFDWSHSLGPALAFYSLFQGRFLKAAEISLALPAFHFATNAIHQIHLNPLMRPLVKRAAGMQPGSAELDKLVGEIERRMQAVAVVGARAPSP